MKPSFSALVAAGWLDDAIRIIAARGIKYVRGNEKWFKDARAAMRARMGYDIMTMGIALDKIWDTARLAVNRGTRYGGTDGPLPGPSGNPSVVTPGLTGGVRVEYHVVVEYRDPLTGGVARVPVTVDSATGLTRDRLDSLAAQLGVTDDWWTASGKRGEITPDSAVYVSTTILGITSR